MKVLLVEDEPLAAQRLETLVKSLEPSVTILAKLDTVKRTVEWLKSNPPPDLIFMDIQLADGVSFLIFEQCEVKSPIIFTTAYDEYALRAFKVNSIDYILKPVDKDEVAAAMLKFKNITKGDLQTSVLLNSIGQAVDLLTKRYKSRFVIKVGEHLKTVEVDTILYFHSHEKTTFCCTTDNRNLILDFTLEQLDDLIDPSTFFRINRKYLVRSSAIQDIISYTNSRLKLVLKGSSDNDVIVARERVQEFKDWLDR